MRWLVAVALTAACTRSEPAPAKTKAEEPAPARTEPAPAPAKANVAPDAPAVAALPAGCATKVTGLLGAIQRARKAMQASDAGARAWRDFAAECRGAAWFTAAAILLRDGEPAPLEVDGVSLATPRDAIDRALAADPGDLVALGYAAYLHAIDPAAAPAITADTCGGTDDAAGYACGHRLLAAGSYEDAALRFAKIADPPYPDVGVRVVEAQAAAGHDKAARAAIDGARATLEKYADRLGVAAGDLRVLRDQLDAAAR